MAFVDVIVRNAARDALTDADLSTTSNPRNFSIDDTSKNIVIFDVDWQQFAKWVTLNKTPLLATELQK